MSDFKIRKKNNGVFRVILITYLITITGRVEKFDRCDRLKVMELNQQHTHFNS